MDIIFHITTNKAWELAIKDGKYISATLKKEGFIHCSKLHQLTRVASAGFAGQHNLVLLCINSKKLKSEIRYEGENKNNIIKITLKNWKGDKKWKYIW